MKIRNEINNRVTGKISKSNIEIKNSQNNPKSLKTISQNSINSTRSLTMRAIDSMALAQLSNDLVKQAMITSARLKNLSADLLNTGNIDQTKLNEALSNIIVSSNETGITASINTQHIPTPQRSKEQLLPDLEKNLIFIKDTAKQIKKDPTVNTDLLESINLNHKDLETKALEIKSELLRSEQEFSKLTKTNIIKSDLPIDEIANTTINSISSIPHQALLSQGFLIPDMVSHLFK